MYRFNKVRQDDSNDHVYQNDLFLKDHHGQLKEIRRKETVAKPQSLVPYEEGCSGHEWENSSKS